MQGYGMHYWNMGWVCGCGLVLIVALILVLRTRK